MDEKFKNQIDKWALDKAGKLNEYKYTIRNTESERQDKILNRIDETIERHDNAMDRIKNKFFLLFAGIIILDFISSIMLAVFGVLKPLEAIEAGTTSTLTLLSLAHTWKLNMLRSHEIGIAKLETQRDNIINQSNKTVENIARSFSSEEAALMKYILKTQKDDIIKK